MSVKQIAIDNAKQFPHAAAAVHSLFNVDDGLVGGDLHGRHYQVADTAAGALCLRRFLVSQVEGKSP